MKISHLFKTNLPSSFKYPYPQIFNLYSFDCFRAFSASSLAPALNPNPTRKQISEILNLIRSGRPDLESRLNGINVSLSDSSLNSIFRILNCEKVPALRFFNWVRQSNPQLYLKSDISSLVFDNCCRLHDFDSLVRLLNEFRQHGICLNRKAFGFLPVGGGVGVNGEGALRESLLKLVEVLKKTGGSSGVSGIHALIDVLCGLGSFEMAKSVIAKAGKRLSNYTVLIRGMCRKGDFEQVREILDEMVKGGCNPNSQTFNFVLSYVCKTDKLPEALQMLQLMVASGCPPDALTFEIVICYLCRVGRLDMAFEWLDRMVSSGIEPRLTTHAAFIKGYFELKQYEEARNYAVVYGDKYKNASNMIYSTLASLYRKQNQPVVAHSILSEMIEKGLKPSFAVYMNVRNHLWKSGREDLARNLESSFSRLISMPSA